MVRAIHLYYHSPCFDGAVSAALTTAYLQHVKGYSEACLHGVNYHLKDQWLATHLEHPCAVVDFLYHPATDYWADHHATAFLNEGCRRHYETRRGLDVFYDGEATSCALLLWRRWGDALPHLSAHFEPLIHWADRIDSARYASVEEAILFKAPALQINLALGTSRDELFSQRLVHLMRDRSLDEIIVQPEVRNEFETGRNLQQRGLDRLKCDVETGAMRLTENGIVVFDIDFENISVSRYAPFYFYPQARYSAGIFRTGNDAKITTMRNPWMEFPSAPLGQLCAQLGGGGHQRVGSILVKNADPRILLADLLGAITAWERASLAEASI